MAENQITDIVRRVVSSLRNLPDTTETGESSGSSSSSRPDNISLQQELNQRFQLPRVQGTTTTRTPRGGTGRFVPYTSASKNKKGKATGKQPAELVIKDVCLLPSPDWDQVPRRQTKEDLVKGNFFIDAWTIDKTWPEKVLRSKLYELFKHHLLGEDDFEFVKSVGNTISNVKLPNGQEANAKIIRHISGAGPIYIRSLTKIDGDEVDAPCVHLDSDESTSSDIRCYTVRNSILHENTATQHSNASSSSQAENLHPLNQGPSEASSNSACALETVDNKQNEQTTTFEEDIWSLCDLETQHLREMFPTCPEDVLTAASRCGTVDTAVDYVINNLSDEAKTIIDGKNVCVKDVLKTLQPLTVAPLRLTVSRSSIFADSLSLFKQRNFDFRKPIRVTFEGEPAIDGGGPRREFFTIVLRDILSPSTTPRLFEGRNNHFLPMHNTDALRANLYKVVGRMVASSIIQGGPGFPYLPKAVYAYFKNPLSEDLTEHLSQEDVVDQECLDALNKLDGMTKENEKSVASEVQTLLIESGFPHCLNVENRFQAMTSLCLHGVLLSRKAELDQFLLGLGPLVECIRRYPNIMEPLFVAGHAKIPTADNLLSIIEYENVSDEIKDYFTQYLQSDDARIPSLLMFATGTDSIPPMGFYNPSVITVLWYTSVYPNTNTCPLELELPGGVDSYEQFKCNMDSALKIQEVGFGIV